MVGDRPRGRAHSRLRQNQEAHELTAVRVSILSDHARVRHDEPILMIVSCTPGCATAHKDEMDFFVINPVYQSHCCIRTAQGL